MIKETFKEMCRIEGINEADVELFVGEGKFIIKNTNEDIEFPDFINAYFDVKDYNYIQEFYYIHRVSDVEIIEFILE